MNVVVQQVQCRAGENTREYERMLSARAHRIAERLARRLCGAWTIIRHEASGRPVVVDAHTRRTMPGWSVSISHTEGLVACAMSAAPIGIDVEGVRFPTAGVLRHCFSADERASIRASDTRRASEYASGLWTLKEAYGKLIGLGLRDLALIRACNPAFCRDRGLEVCQMTLRSHGRRYRCSIVHGTAASRHAQHATTAHSTYQSSEDTTEGEQQ
ncbi:4'-phosphopantetheinyl transferase superfamily protein [Bifidobacterium sp. 82T24]|uniref:4'-phosphopantetheinyl transferase family protein n=1 Tax=Bifidobacterium pluvialisilvae TaxID=2834436 RepID=UPI001C570F2F|nr:4'-phosphopantetheinyl transferase superfamily protein [Bifidobacterium pluvialisilvae]MBW3087582.1 4'-phosphopantetheinyl transferase superfamily protein [Bifidobacterium pluvialisilvae]